ncbi:MAG TPA: aldo/keto reductase [Casimicrobiaceae bacterium]|nr:aldo/keto reductase [Casimicrobiaceae bacterium]
MQPDGAVPLRARLASNRPALGGAPLGNLFRALDDATAHATVQAALAAGTSYFDTAPHYGHGLSERRIGAALHGVPRPAFLLSTKVGRLLTACTDAPRAQHGYVDTLPFVQHYDYTGRGMRRSLEESLRRLGLGHVDIAYVHDIDAATHGAEHPRHLRDLYASGLAELARMKEEGIIAAYGLGVNDVAICIEVLARADLDVLLVAGRYTLADQSALATLLPMCRARGVAVVLGGPFNSGILASGAHPADGTAPYFNYAPAPASLIERVAAIEGICSDYGVPLKAAALQFPRGHAAVACVLAGARTPAEVEENARLARLPIPRAFWTALVERHLVDAASPVPEAA